MFNWCIKVCVCVCSSVYLCVAIQVGLTERYNGGRVQCVGRQVIGHVTRQINQSHHRSLTLPDTEILQHSTIPRLIHVYHHK